MIDLLISALIQISLITGQPANAIGNSGWGGGDVTSTSTTQSNAIGNSGWGGGDATPPAPTTPPTGTGIGNSGWGGGD